MNRMSEGSPENSLRLLPMYEEVMEKLFSAKLNIPQASKLLGMETNSESWDSLKKEFANYCKSRWDRVEVYLLFPPL
jgi:hypothetical protein